jgi:hypothetical protein
VDCLRYCRFFIALNDVHCNSSSRRVAAVIIVVVLDA